VSPEGVEAAFATAQAAWPVAQTAFRVDVPGRLVPPAGPPGPGLGSGPSGTASHHDAQVARAGNKTATSRQRWRVLLVLRGRPAAAGSEGTRP
jgi:hypothetical protein